MNNANKPLRKMSEFIIVCVNTAVFNFEYNLLNSTSEKLILHILFNIRPLK